MENLLNILETLSAIYTLELLSIEADDMKNGVLFFLVLADIRMHYLVLMRQATMELRKMVVKYTGGLLN